MNISNTKVLITRFDYECFEHKVLCFSYIFMSESDEDIIKKTDIYNLFWKIKKKS